jgi:phage tail sheath protein FI
MAVQVSYPGVYIEEFEPAAPIEGVSTSTAALIGIAERGPIRQPTLVTSLDEFEERFGGPVDGPVPYYLPIAAEGFFRNGGTVCYVVRVGTAVKANADLLSRAGPNDPVIHAEAVAEGTAGGGLTITVSDSSLLADRLAAIDPALAPELKLATAEANVTGLDATRRVLTVDSSDGFTAGDKVVVDDGGTDRPGVVADVPDATTIRLASALGGSQALAANAKVKIADLDVGDKRLRLEVASGLNLRQALPAGTLVEISGAPGADELATVAAVSADTIELVRALSEQHDIGTAVVASREFDIVVTGPAGQVETFEHLSASSNHPRYWQTVADSDLVELTKPAAPAQGAVPDPRPQATATPLGGAQDDDPATAWQSVANDMGDHLDLLAPIDDVSIVAAPGCTDQGAQQAIVEHCETLFDRFAILDSDPTADLTAVRAQRAALTGVLDKGFGALYHPWIQVRDPAKAAVVAHPPAGHLAGVYAKTDQTKGVHHAPANVGIATALGVTERFTDADQSVVNLEGVNLIRILPGRGIPVVWGARTTAGNRNWQYINIRRLFLFLEESIQESLRGSVFEPNDLGLWERLKRTLNEFLTRVWRDGALFGATAKEAFYVRIDEVLNPPSTRKLGRLYIEIGVQPVYPAEFIVVRIGIWDGGAEVSES